MKKKKLAITLISVFAISACIACLFNRDALKEESIMLVQSVVNDQDLDANAWELWSDPSFRGQSITGLLSESHQSAAPALSFDVKSFRIGRNVSLTITFTKGTSSSDNTVNGPYMESDIGQSTPGTKITHVYLVQTYSFLIGVTIFPKPWNTCFTVFGKGNYTKDNFQSFRYNCGGINAITVPAGLRAELYTQDLWQGSQKIIYGPGQASWENDPNWKDKVLSFRIREKNDTITQVRGYWKFIAGNNGQVSAATTVGVAKTDTQTQSTQAAAEIAFAIEADEAPFGIGSKQTLTTSATLTLGSEFSQAVELSQTFTVTLTCDGQGPNIYTTLWIWAMDGLNKDSQVVITNTQQIGVCRSGDNSPTPPSCPKLFCANAQCTECLPGGLN